MALVQFRPLCRFLGMAAVVGFGLTTISCSKDAPAPAPQEAAQPTPPPNPMAQFGGGACEVASLSGFYAPENWGAWSSEDPAEINLKSDLTGTVKLRFRAYTLDDQKAHELKIKIGDTSKPVSLTPAPANYDLEYTLAVPTRKIVLSGLKPRSAATDKRLMGVGFVRVDCTAGK